MGNLVIVTGSILILIGLFINLIDRSDFPRLPGDILIQRDGFTFYSPLVTSLLLSILITLLLNFFRKQ